MSSARPGLTTLKSRKLEWILAGLLVLVVWIQFSNTLSHGYAWDDAISITENPRVLKGLAGIPEHFQFRDRAVLADFNGYRPITFSTFSLDIALFGQNPQAGHAMQLVYYSLLLLAIFFSLRAIFPDFHPFYAFAATLLFAVHPLHVEVVANIKSRDEILAMLFGILSLRYFINFSRQPSPVSAVLSVLFFVLAMLSKEGSIALLGVMALSAWSFSPNRRKLLLSGGFIAAQVVILLGVFLLLTGRLPGATPEETTTGFVENIIVTNSHAVDMGFFQRLMNSGHLMLLYLREFIFPVDLVYTSGYNQIPVLEGFSVTGLLSLLLLIVVPLAMLWLLVRKKLPALTFGYFFFFISVLLYLHLLFPIADTMADRFMFMPSLGLCWMVVAVVPGLLKKKPSESPLYFILGGLGTAVKVEKGQASKSSKQSSNQGRSSRDSSITGKSAKRTSIIQRIGQGYLLLITIALLFFYMLTWKRNPIWKSTLDLVTADMPKLANCGRAHYLYANELVKANQNSLGGPEMEIAVSHLKQAIEISPYLFYARLDLGNLLNMLKRDQEAVAVLQKAVEMFPDHEDTYFFLGRAQYLSGNYPAAISNLNQAISLRPDDLGSIELLGRAYNKTQDFEKGLVVIGEALVKSPDNVMLLDVYSDLLFDSGSIPESFDPIFRMIEVQGQAGAWWKKLIGRYQLIGDTDNAARYYQMALERGVLQP